MKVSNNLPRICDHLIKPWSKKHTPKEKKIAWATTLILGVASGGLIQTGALLLKGVLILTKNGYSDSKGVSIPAKVNSLSQINLSSTSVSSKVNPPSPKKPAVAKLNVAKLKKERGKLNKQIGKNLAKEKKLAKEITEIRDELTLATTIDRKKINDIIQKNGQLKEQIRETRELEKKRNDILSKLNLPEENVSHPEVDVIQNLFNKFTELMQRFRELAKKDPNTKENVMAKLKPYSEQIKRIGKQWKNIKNDDDEEIEILTIELNKLYLQLKAISN